MNEYSQKVNVFFSQPENYLRNSANIRIRALVVRELLGDDSGKRILDIGCGDGNISLPLLKDDNSLTLLDASEEMIKIAKENVPYKYSQQVFFNHNNYFHYYPDHPFDVVLCLGVLAHVPSIPEGIYHLSRLVKPGGSCIVQLTDHDQRTTRIKTRLESIGLHRVDRHQYQLNRTCLSEILYLARVNRMEISGYKRYSLLIPGMGFFTSDLLYRYLLATLRLPQLSKHGTEIIVKLKRLSE